MKKQEFKRIRRGLGTSRTTLNIANHRGARGEEEEQKIQNLFEQIMKENFPNLAKEIDFQEVQEAQSAKKVGPKKAHTKAPHNYIIQDER